MTEAYSHVDPTLAARGAFTFLMGAVCQRFDEAVKLNDTVPGYRHFLAGPEPGVEDPLATFSLAESYELMRAHRAEELIIGVPIAQTDTVKPELKVGNDPDKDYFLLQYWKRSKLAGIVVDYAAYERFFFTESRRTPVRDLTQKLLTYQVIPVRKPV